MKFIVLFLLRIVQVLFEFVRLIGESFLPCLSFLKWWLSMIFDRCFSFHFFLSSLDGLFEHVLIVFSSWFHFKLLVSALDFMHSCFKIFEFCIKLVYLIIDLFHFIILFYVFLLGSLGCWRGLLDDIFLFDAIKSDEHFFFSGILIDHGFMFQHFFQFSLPDNIRRFLALNTLLTFLIAFLSTLQSPHFRYLPYGCLRFLLFCQPVLLFKMILRPVHLEMVGKREPLLRRFIICLFVFFRIQKGVVV